MRTVTIILGLAVALVATAPSMMRDTLAGTDDIAATRQEVVQVQKQLNALGYPAGPEDGQYGQKTRKAIVQFEREHDLERSGLPTDRVMSRIEKAYQKSRDEGGDSPESAPAKPVEEKPLDEAKPKDRSNAQDAARQDRTTTRLELPGTRWLLRHPQGEDVVLRFHADGKIDGPAGSWSWTREDGRIVIQYNSGSRLSSRLIATEKAPSRMSGWGRDTFGQRWDWSAMRMKQTGKR